MERLSERLPAANTLVFHAVSLFFFSLGLLLHLQSLLLQLTYSYPPPPPPVLGCLR